MAWLAVVIAGLLEIGFAVALKESAGFSRTGWVVIFLLCAAGSFWLLSLALKSLPVGSAYAVWTGIGAAGTAVVGIVALGEGAEPLKLAAIAAIIVGVVGLQLAGTAH